MYINYMSGVCFLELRNATYKQTGHSGALNRGTKLKQHVEGGRR